MILASQESIRKYTEMGVWSRTTLLDHFFAHAKKEPDRVCVVDPPNKVDLLGAEPERVTYAKMARAIESTASALLSMGIKKDDVIMVQLPNCWELAMLYLAVGRVGAIISPAPVLWRESELGHIAELTEASLFITAKEFGGFKHAEMGERLRASSPSISKVMTYEELREMSRGPADDALSEITLDADDIFTICWTSGTEARSKGCPLSHNNWAGMAMLQNCAGMRPGDTLLTAGPLANMASVGTVFIPWIILGGTMVLHHPFDPPGFFAQIRQEKPNYTLLVPALANMIVKDPNVDKFDLSSFRNITLGSAPPSLWSMQEFKRRWDIDIGNIWGQNEGTCIVAGLDDIPEMERRVAHFPQWGKPGVKWNTRAAEVIEIRIVDGNGNEVTKVGEVGELVYKGPGLMAGYFRNPEVTRRSFTEDGFFRTGDMFRIRDGNCLSFYERGKDIIIRGGYNISSQEVENHLLEHPGVQEVAVVGMPDEKLGERMCAYVVPLEGNVPALGDLSELLTEKGVALYKHPERIETIDAIPRNPVGKVLKNVLREDIKSKLEN